MPRRRRLLAGITALVSGAVTGIALFAWSEGSLQREDALGVGTLSLAGGLVCVLLQYAALSYLRRRGRAGSATRRVVIAAGVINIPIYALLLQNHLRGGVFAPGEAALWGTVFVVIAVVFGALFR